MEEIEKVTLKEKRINCKHNFVFDGKEFFDEYSAEGEGLDYIYHCPNCGTVIKERISNIQ